MDRNEYLRGVGLYNTIEEVRARRERLRAVGLYGTFEEVRARREGRNEARELILALQAALAAIRDGCENPREIAAKALTVK